MISDLKHTALVKLCYICVKNSPCLMYVIEGIHEIKLVLRLIKSGRVAEFFIWSAHMFNLH